MKIILRESLLERTIEEPLFGVCGIDINKKKSLVSKRKTFFFKKIDLSS